MQSLVVKKIGDEFGLNLACHNFSSAVLPLYCSYLTQYLNMKVKMAGNFIAAT